MNKYKPLMHHRKSIRLKGYDYSQKGLYFITICTQNREYMFGKIIETDLRVGSNKIMQLNNAGQMIKKWYYELENKYNDIKCHEMIIMPNHIHFIVENVGADLRVCPNNSGEHVNNSGEHVNNSGEHVNNSGEHVNNSGEHVGSPLPTIVQWFKTMTTNEYIRGVKNNIYPPFDKRIWQRNYWEHIIRNQNEYMRISQYIINNPLNWDKDRLNDGDGNKIMEPSTEYKTEPWII
jgi:REP element-mobilizing transposase RayT